MAEEKIIRLWCDHCIKVHDVKTEVDPDTGAFRSLDLGNGPRDWDVAWSCQLTMSWLEMVDVYTSEGRMPKSNVKASRPNQAITTPKAITSGRTLVFSGSRKPIAHICPWCSEPALTSFQALGVHFQRVHGMNMDELPLTCPLCDRMRHPGVPFASLDGLNKHCFRSHDMSLWRAFIHAREMGDPYGAYGTATALIRTTRAS